MVTPKKMPLMGYMPRDLLIINGLVAPRGGLREVDADRTRVEGFAPRYWSAWRQRTLRQTWAARSTTGRGLLLENGTVGQAFNKSTAADPMSRRGTAILKPYQGPRRFWKMGGVKLGISTAKTVETTAIYGKRRRYHQGSDEALAAGRRGDFDRQPLAFGLSLPASKELRGVCFGNMAEKVRAAVGHVNRWAAKTMTCASTEQCGVRRAGQACFCAGQGFDERCCGSLTCWGRARGRRSQRGRFHGRRARDLGKPSCWASGLRAARDRASGKVLLGLSGRHRFARVNGGDEAEAMGPENTWLGWMCPRSISSQGAWERLVDLGLAILAPGL